MMYPYYGMFYDPTYLLVIIGAAICLMASFKVKTTFNMYSNYRASCGMTGREIAERILRGNEMGQVEVHPIRGQLTDHFDPRNMTVSLSDPVYSSTSIAALAVASHECGHVLQHRDNYFPYNFRHALVPVANIGSSLSWILIIAGIFLGQMIGTANSQVMINTGILLFSLAVLFQLVTLPVELNASRRALKILNGSGRFTEEELKIAKKVLSAAALTYVAAAASALLQLLRIVLLFGRRRD